MIKQTFKGRIAFLHTGVSPVDQEDEKNRMKTQLESFYYSLLNHGLEGYKKPKTWMEAFFQLEQLLTKLDDGSRQVVFIDELPSDDGDDIRHHLRKTQRYGAEASCDG